jgi:putative phage-type endonuclease
MEFIEVQKDETKKAEWLEKRKHYVTGTDAAQLLGISPFGSKFSVWLDKTGQGQEIAQTAAMRAGLAFEPAILKMYAEDTYAKVEHMDGYDLHTSDNFPRLGASLDGWNHTLGIPVDAKNIHWKNEKWGDAWTSDFPEYYKTQLQVQMMVTGARFAHLAVMFAGQDFYIYQMEWDDELAKAIVDAADSLFELIASGEMPEAGGDDNTSAYIKDTFAIGTPDLEKEADESLQKYVADYKAASAAEKDAKAKKDEAGNRIKVFMGDATVVPGFCTWKNAKDSQKTDWEAVAKAAMENMSVLEREELVAKYTETKPGNRTLRITAKGF